MALKIVLSCIEEGEGWSEVQYSGLTDIAAFAGSPRANQPAAGTLAIEYLEKRRAILNRRSYMNHLRVSKVESPGVFTAFDLPPAFGRGNFTDPASDRQNNNATEIIARLLVREHAGTTKHRSLWLGGIPETIIVPPQTFLPTAAWVDVFAEYRDFVIANFCCYGRPVRGLPNEIPIGAFQVDSIDGKTLTIGPTPLPGTPAAGQPFKIVLRGIKNPRGWNGIHNAVVSVVDGLPGIVVGPVRKAGVSLPLWNHTGSMQVFQPLTPAITQLTQVRVSGRKSGRPFGSPRGRRS